MFLLIFVYFTIIFPIISRFFPSFFVTSNAIILYEKTHKTRKKAGRRHILSGAPKDSCERKCSRVFGPRERAHLPGGGHQEHRLERVPEVPAPVAPLRRVPAAAVCEKPASTDARGEERRRGGAELGRGCGQRVADERQRRVAAGKAEA